MTANCGVHLLPGGLTVQVLAWAGWEARQVQGIEFSRRNVWSVGNQLELKTATENGWD